MSADLETFDDLWDYSKPSETEQRFRALLPAAEGQPYYYLQVLTQIARAQGLQRRFAEAHRTLDEVARQLTPEPAVPRIRYLLERGRVYNSSGEKEKALPLFGEALSLSSAAGEDSYAVDAAHMLAIASPAEETLAWNLEALRLAEASADESARRWRASLYNNIGWTYHEQGDYATALRYLEMALATRREYGQKEQTRVARWCVARVKRDLGRVEEALAEQEALLRETDAQPDGFVYEEIAECLNLLGREAEARPYFALAYRELSQDTWLAAEQPARLERLQRLSEGGQE